MTPKWAGHGTYPPKSPKAGHPLPDPAPWYKEPPCNNAKHAPCPDCSGEIVVGQFENIVVPRLDADGFPELDPQTARPMMIQLALPVHVARVPHSEFLPTALRDA